MKSVRLKNKQIIQSKQKTKLIRTVQPSVNIKVRPQDKEKFFKLHRDWSEMVGFWSDEIEMTSDEGYKMLRKAFPDDVLAKLIFDYIQNEPSWIMTILPELLNIELDFSEDEKNNAYKMAKKWVNWALENGYLT